MKPRSAIKLILATLVAGIVIWLYFTATRKAPEHETGTWDSTLSDLHVCGSNKHIGAARYNHYATVAEAENEPSAACLFKALALSEQVQESNCATAISRLGGSYIPPVRIVIMRGTTAENLARSIEAEVATIGTPRHEDIDRAFASGNRYAARTLIWAAASTRHNLALMRQLRAARAADSLGYTLCPTCGNLYNVAECDPYCPHCMTPQHEFIVVQN